MPLLYHADALEDIPRQDLSRLRNKIDWLWANRKAVNHLPLSRNLAGFNKRRLGKYRIVYTFDSSIDDLVVYLVGLRDVVYDSFKPDLRRTADPDTPPVSTSDEDHQPPLIPN